MLKQAVGLLFRELYILIGILAGTAQQLVGLVGTSNLTLGITYEKTKHCLETDDACKTAG